MRKRESGRSRELDEVRRMLFPGLSPEEGWARIDAAIDGAADPERWEAIERLAGDDLSRELLERLRAIRGGRPDAPDAA